ncbi:MAG: right-handed parallel beta-helix repeat-containing protein, partial [Thermoplasmata archaeon]
VVLYGNAYTIRDCNITSNGAYGIFLISATNSLIFGTNISNNSYGIRVQDTSNTIVINSSINNSNSYDLYLRDRSELVLLNTTFNKTSVYFYDAESELTVMWYMHVYVNDTLGNPVSDAKVIVRNATGVVVFDRLTDTEGYCKWIVVTEYIENLEYTDYHTPHNVTASNETLIGRATPEPNMDRSKLENIILYKKPTIDFIEISDALGGTPLTGGTVPPNYQEWGYCSAYNYTLGYIETISANWTAQGGVCFLLGPTPAETNGIDVGNTPGNVWLNASYFNGTSWYNDSVMYTIPTPPIVPGAPRELRIHRGGGTWPATQDDLYITWIAPTENWEHLKYNILYYDTDLSNGFQYDNYLLLGRNSSGPGTQDFCVLQGWYADSYNYVFKVNTTNDTKGSYENMTGTNVGYKYGKVLDSTMDFVWVSLPYHCDYTNATLITDDAFPDDTHISSIKKWNYTTQSYEVRTYLLGKWEGDFNIEPGDAVLIFVTIPSGSYNWKIVGAHDPDLEFELHENLGTTDFKILSLPYHRSYQNATHITNEFPDRSKIETVGQYNYTSNKWETRHNSLILGWMGDFDVQSSPVDVILLDVTSTVPYYWKPQVMDF